MEVNICIGDPFRKDATLVERNSRCLQCIESDCPNRVAAYIPIKLITSTYNWGDDLPSALNTQVAGSHYKDMAIQPAVFITKNKIEFLPGCVIKRMCRWRKKDGVQDLEKAIHEIQLMIELQREENPK